MSVVGNHIETDDEPEDGLDENLIEDTDGYKVEIVWVNVAVSVLFHILAFYGVWIVLTNFAFINFAKVYMVGYVIGLGTTAGAHRLWAHRAYKARLPLRIFLVILQTFNVQNSVYEWVRDHRVHHKFSETNADPHNAKRGFFFAHMGWLLCKKHPDVKAKGRLVDLSDLEADPLIMWQHRHYVPLSLACLFIFPTIYTRLLTGEDWSKCFFVGAMFRYVLTLHYTWLVNSAAHMWGRKPYDRTINPSENKVVAILALGEGWHNYHHVFPWDYKTSELGSYSFNITTAFIDLCQILGLAYDLKTVSPEVVKQRVKKTGDGTHDRYDKSPQQGINEKNNNQSSEIKIRVKFA